MQMKMPTMEGMKMSDDPTHGLPEDLAAALANPSLDVPQDAAVFNLVHSWMAAPATTMSAGIDAPSPEVVVRFDHATVAGATGAGCPPQG